MSTIQTFVPSQANPILSLPFLYTSGMNISVASTTVLAIEPGQCRDMNNTIDMPIAFSNLQGITSPNILVSNYQPPLYLNSAVNGANGLDQGTLAVSSNYCIYVIGDSTNKNPTAGLISLYSNAYPLIPTGYDSFRLLGFVSTDSSAHFTAASVLNTKYSKGYYLQPNVSVLSGGNATTFTAINLSSAIPTTTDPFVIAILSVTFSPSNAASILQFRPTGSSATAGLVTINAITAGNPQQQYQYVMTGVATSVPSIDYKVSNSGDSVNVSVNGYLVTLS